MKTYKSAEPLLQPLLQYHLFNASKAVCKSRRYMYYIVCSFEMQTYITSIPKDECYCQGWLHPFSVVKVDFKMKLIDMLTRVQAANIQYQEYRLYNPDHNHV